MLLVSVSGCSSSRNSTGQEKNSSGDDTKISTSGLDLKSPENLAPGTARVRLSVQTMEGSIWRSEIKEVLGYGSSTPPLGVGNQIEIDITTYVKTTDDDARELAKRDELICLIRHRELRQGATGSSWSLVNVFE